MDHSRNILQSWTENANNWISVINNNEIESRKTVTNAAIIETILSFNPEKVVDLGCGEGWLTRSLRAHGIDAHGVDGIETLVNDAIEKGGRYYSCFSYKEIIQGKCTLLNESDVAINFALLDKNDTEDLIGYLGRRLQKGKHIFIQTLHPFNMAMNGDYEPGWRDGSWDGLNKDFTNPYKWYFRTLEAWSQLFTQSQLRLIALKEPVHPVTHKPASVIFVLMVAG